MTTIGSLFSGYGGLDLAVHMAIPDTRTVWVSDVEPGPNKILAQRFPGIPNLGDITTIDWDQVEPVDILVGGSPCQDLSTAGQRAGMKPGTRSGLWESMTHAIEQLQPRLVVWENVRGALSATAFSESDRSDSERHRLCVCGGIDRRGGVHSHRRDEGEVVRPENGPRDDEASSKRYDGTSSRVRRDPSDHAPSYREMGGGMDVLRSRGGLREASAGRDSVFENQETSRRVGYPSKRDQERTATADEWPVSVDGSGAGKVPRNQTGGQEAQSQGSRGHCGKCGGCLNEPCADSDVEPGTGPMGNEPDGPVLRALGRVLGDLANLGYDAEWTTVRASDVGAPHRRERVFVIAYPHGERFGRFSGRTGGRSQEVSTTISDPPLPPTPTVGDKGGPEARSGEGFGAPLGEIVRLLRTPRASEAEGGPLHPEVAKSRNQTLRLTGQVLAATGNLADSSGNTDNSWGVYAPAIHRWEYILEREAPAPTTLSAHGKPQLSPRFVEWMMGLPAGWVTDVPISRANQLRALGNGVVPQQAAYAITEIMNW